MNTNQETNPDGDLSACLKADEEEEEEDASVGKGNAEDDDDQRSDNEEAKDTLQPMVDRVPPTTRMKMTATSLASLLVDPSATSVSVSLAPAAIAESSFATQIKASGAMKFVGGITHGVLTVSRKMTTAPLKEVEQATKIRKELVPDTQQQLKEVVGSAEYHSLIRLSDEQLSNIGTFHNLNTRRVARQLQLSQVAAIDCRNRVDVLDGECQKLEGKLLTKREERAVSKAQEVLEKKKSLDLEAGITVLENHKSIAKSILQGGIPVLASAARAQVWRLAGAQWDATRGAVGKKSLSLIHISEPTRPY